MPDQQAEPGTGAGHRLELEGHQAVLPEQHLGDQQRGQRRQRMDQQVEAVALQPRQQVRDVEDRDPARREQRADAGQRIRKVGGGGQQRAGEQQHRGRQCLAQPQRAQRAGRHRLGGDVAVAEGHQHRGVEGGDRRAGAKPQPGGDDAGEAIGRAQGRVAQHRAGARQLYQPAIAADQDAQRRAGDSAQPGAGPHRVDRERHEAKIGDRLAQRRAATPAGESLPRLERVQTACLPTDVPIS